MELDQAFDPNSVPEDDRTFDPLPAGDYLMQVTESEIKPTKSGSGEQLILTLEVVDGPHQNRKVWDRLNIRNENADAQRIAQRALADLCLAIGVTSLRDTSDLHFKPFTGRVTIQADKTGQYGPQNRVRYKPRSGQPPAGKAPVHPGAGAAGQPAAQRQTTAAAPAAGARPWKKSA